MCAFQYEPPRTRKVRKFCCPNCETIVDRGSDKVCPKCGVSLAWGPIEVAERGAKPSKQPLETVEEVDVKPPSRVYNILLFLLYCIIVASLAFALVAAINSTDAETKKLAPTIITAITTIAGFAVGVNAAPKTPSTRE